MARPIAPTHALKRDELLDAAATVFARNGYAKASMQDIADECGVAKGTLYHYHRTKDALLFDLLDRYTQHLLVIVAQSEAAAQRLRLSDRARAHELINRYLAAYQSAGARHAVLLNDTRFLPPEQRELIVNRQRDVVLAFTRCLSRAYPERFTPERATALTMMVFGMINWTFTWLKPDGPMSYAEFANLVIETLESGFTHS